MDDVHKPEVAVGHHEDIEMNRVEEHSHHHGHHKLDAAAKVLGEGERIQMTDEQSQLVCRKIDKHIMPPLCWVYFLQILDKSCVGYGATFGLQAEAHLVGNQYSLISSSGYWAQLAFCFGLTAFFIVRVPTRILMSTCLLCWGVSMIGLAFSTSFGPLLANRFLLGMFEAVNIPLFTVISMTWYRRREQPMRIAMWYGTNGVASMLGSLLAWALSFISSPVLYVYQILFLTVGIATVLTAPLIFLILDDSPAVARFLSPTERQWAVERLRSNNTGVETKEFKWKQVLETFTSPTILIFFILTFCVNTGAGVTNTFGPLIISGFGFNARQTILLNIPFGFVQTCVCLLGCWLSVRFGFKGFTLMSFMIPCVIGASLLYGLGRATSDQGGLLVGYYLIAFLFGGNPLIFSWLAANTAGHTKKSLSISLCNAGSAVGNIVAPLMFNSAQAPYYHPGLGAVLGLFVACFALSGGQTALLLFLNKHKEKVRVAHGKPAKLIDTSNDKKYSAVVAATEDKSEGAVNAPRLGDQAFMDLTDRQNDEFVYTY